MRLFGNPFHVHAELAPASPDALALLNESAPGREHVRKVSEAVALKIAYVA